MAATSHFRGHSIYWDGKQWRFSDNDEPTVSTYDERPCGYCGEHKTKEGHDPCLGTLPGVMNACCGHGTTELAYVQYQNGHIVRDDKAISDINTLKGTNK